MAKIINQNPEQKARDKIDLLLEQSGWIIQDMKSINLFAGKGIAIKEYKTEIGPADYILFVEKKTVGVIEAKKEEEEIHLTVTEEQSNSYSKSKLKYLDNNPLPFIFESTGTITRFTNLQDLKPRSRDIFTFYKPETLYEWINQDKSLRSRLNDLPELKTNGLRECQMMLYFEKSIK